MKKIANSKNPFLPVGKKGLFLNKSSIPYSFMNFTVCPSAVRMK